ncbi:MAG: hypothetical protein HYZ50_11190 [Deltaproteobacteria bacterium]|nr:hypothetical protein [Deltaproteobacteria bacterium]
MKRVTATEARKQWFRLLDEVACGEVVVLERKGRRLVLCREDARKETLERRRLNYDTLLRAPDAEQAAHWTWDWPGPEQELVSVARRAR